MNAKPTYSVLIPTRERAITLRSSLRTLTTQARDDLEIVVSDNCSVDETRDVVEEASDPRVRYCRTERRLSMSENWEFGLSQCRGEWISIIGDDDGFLPGAFERIDALRAAAPDAEALVSRCCSYVWPSVFGGEGRLFVPLRKGWQRVDSRQKLAEVMRGDVPYLELPIIYNGTMVKREAIDRARDKNGRFFLSCIPDVYSGIALCCACDSFVLSEEPVAINGASKFSTGTSQMRSANSSSKQLDAAKKFMEEGNLPFHPRVPLREDGGYPRALQALVLECYLQAQTVFSGLPEVDVSRQIEVVLRDAGSEHPELEEWTLRLAELNQVSVPQAPPTVSGFERGRDSVVALLRKLRSVRDVTLAAPAQYPASDVYEAAQNAAQLLSSPPSGFESIRNRVRMRVRSRWTKS